MDSATTRFINSTFATQQGAGFSAVMFKTSIIETIKVLKPKQGLLLMKLLNMGLLGSSLYFWIWYLSTNRSSCLNDNADGWFATYFSWWRSVTGTHDPVKQLETVLNMMQLFFPDHIRISDQELTNDYHIIRPEIIYYARMRM